MHIDSLEDVIKPSMKYTLIAYLVPGYNMDESCRPGILIRGCYPDQESAKAAHRKFDNKLTSTIVETGRPLPACPTVSEMQETPSIYSDPELDEILGSMQRMERENAEEFENHRRERKENAVDENSDPEYLESCIKIAEEKRAEIDAHIDELRAKIASSTA